MPDRPAGASVGDARQVAEPAALGGALGDALLFVVARERTGEEGLRLDDGVAGRCDQGPREVAGSRVELVGGDHEVGEAGALGLLAWTKRPVAQISSARAYPTRCTRGWVPVRSGTSPRLVSRMANCTSSATIRRSQARASWKPAPMAWPWTVAIDTRSLRRHQVNASWYSAMVASSSASGPRAMSRNDGSPSKPSG